MSRKTTKCWWPGCHSSVSASTSPLPLYPFPGIKDVDRAHQWVRASRRYDFLDDPVVSWPIKFAFCRLHFPADQFTSPEARKHLSWNAVPAPGRLLLANRKVTVPPAATDDDRYYEESAHDEIWVNRVVEPAEDPLANQPQLLLGKRSYPITFGEHFLSKNEPDTTSCETKPPKRRRRRELGQPCLCGEVEEGKDATKKFCMYYGCKTRMDEWPGPTVRRHTFPATDEARVRLWLQLSNRADLFSLGVDAIRGKRLYLCSHHFDEKMFMNRKNSARMVWDAKPRPWECLCHESGSGGGGVIGPPEERLLQQQIVVKIDPSEISTPAGKTVTPGSLDLVCVDETAEKDTLSQITIQNEPSPKDDDNFFSVDEDTIMNIDAKVADEESCGGGVAAKENNILFEEFGEVN